MNQLFRFMPSISFLEQIGQMWYATHWFVAHNQVSYRIVKQWWNPTFGSMMDLFIVLCFTNSAKVVWITYIHELQKVQKGLLQSDVQSKSDKSPVTVADYGSPYDDPFYLCYIIRLCYSSKSLCTHFLWNFNRVLFLICFECSTLCL